MLFAQYRSNILGIVKGNTPENDINGQAALTVVVEVIAELFCREMGFLSESWDVQVPVVFFNIEGISILIGAWSRQSKLLLLI